MWLGANRNKKAKHFDIAWPSEPVCALGIHFSYNEDVCHQKNFEQKKTLLNIWYPRNLTLYGRELKIVLMEPVRELKPDLSHPKRESYH